MNATIDPHRFLQEIYAEQELPMPLMFKVLQAKITASLDLRAGNRAGISRDGERGTR